MSFWRQNGQIFCEEVPLADIAAAAGTPVYVYSWESIAARARAYLTAAGPAPAGRICFATKANSNLTLLRRLGELGLGADVTSGGELYLALEAGIDPGRIIFSGVGKRDDEILMALRAGIAALHVESAAELEVIEALAATEGITAPIGLRLNPDIPAETHPYISTGLSRHKFGIDVASGVDLLRQAAASSSLRPVGIAAHLGSQITDLAPFARAAELLVDIAVELRSGGVPLTYIDVGGGLGIDYAAWEAGQLADESRIAAWMGVVAPPVREAGFAFAAEPGRSIVGPAGCLLTRTIYVKDRPDRRFIIADAGMNDLLRPTLYQAEHPIVPVYEKEGLERRGGPSLPTDVVGPICESGDFLGKNRPLAAVRRGELLAVMNAGAYGFAMSSQYNGRPRPAEVLVEKGSFTIIRERETYAALRSS